MSEQIPGSGEQRPTLRIVKGNPTAEELAAVAVVLAAARSDADAARKPERKAGTWSDPELRLRRPVQPGPGAWQASARS